MTALNKQLLELIQGSCRHMNAEEVFLLAKEKGIKVSLASVYRILGKLAAEGHIRQLSNPGQPDMFDKNLAPHGHLVCSVCGKITDLWAEGLEQQLQAAAKSPITGYQLTVSYVCPDCTDKD